MYFVHHQGDEYMLSEKQVARVLVLFRPEEGGRRFPQKSKNAYQTTQLSFL
jgi:hypothetical protein